MFEVYMFSCVVLTFQKKTQLLLKFSNYLDNVKMNEEMFKENNLQSRLLIVKHLFLGRSFYFLTYSHRKIT